MSGLWWVLIFGVAYPLIALTVACLGVFGISASRGERLEHAMKTRKYASVDHDEYWLRYRQRQLVVPLIWWTFWSALFWPVAIPLYLAWKKGSFINDALVQRAELAKQHSP